MAPAESASRQAIVSADKQFVWPPYTSSEHHASYDPIVVTNAAGPFLYDADGRQYLDGVASWWTKNLGHRHPRLMAVLRERAESLVHCAMADVTHADAAFLARDLVAVAPKGLERVFFSDNGSTAVEVALKMAFQYWQQNGRPERKRFLSLAGAYHGDTVGAMSVGDLEEFQDLYAPILFETIRAPDPADDPEEGWERVVAAIETRLLQQGDEVAGVVVEPLAQGAIGMRLWGTELLRRLRRVTHEVDTFLIADEVFTGFGRTGRFWACDHAEVSPDLLCTAKALSGGVLPLAATLASERIYDGFRGGLTRTLMHGHTFFGHPLGCALAREVLSIYRDEHILEGLADRGAILDRLVDAARALPGVRQPRRLGMIAAFDVGEPGYYGAAGAEVANHARQLGVYLRPLGNAVYLCPPLNIPLSDLETLCDKTLAAAEHALARKYPG